MAYGQPYSYQTPLYGGQPPLYQPRQDAAGAQYPQMQQGPQPGQQPPQSGYICRPVTSREEALGVQVDFLGPGTVMPDLGHGMVYLKRFNPNTGASDLMEFAYQPPKQEAPPVQYATVEDINALRVEIEALKKPGKAVKRNDSDAE